MANKAHLEIDVEKAHRRKFSISVKTIFSNGIGFPLTNALKKLRITNDFTNHVMPEYRMIFNLAPETIMAIQKDIDKILFEITINSSATTIDTSDGTINTDDAKQEIPDPFLEKVLIKPLLSDKGTLYIPDDIERHDENGNEYNGRAPMKFEIIGVPENALKSNKSVDSGVLRNVTVSEAILLLAGKTGVKVHLSPPDNNTRYPQLILFPGNFYMNLYHINNTYGIYKDELKVYTDDNRIIITPQDSNKTVDTGNVNIRVLFPKSADQGNINIGSYNSIDDTSYARDRNLIVSSPMVAITDNSSLNSELMGTRQHVATRNLYKLDELYYNQTNFDRNGLIAKSRAYENIYSNPYTMDSFVKNNTSPKIITINHKDMDIRPLDGFKAFNIGFDSNDYRKYEGRYKCLAITNEFVLSKRNNYAHRGIIKMKYAGN